MGDCCKKKPGRWARLRCAWRGHTYGSMETNELLSGYGRYKTVRPVFVRTCGRCGAWYLEEY